MPAVIIKGMEMPESCGCCPCFHAETPMYCQAIKVDRTKKIKTPYAVRPDWCPLLPIEQANLISRHEAAQIIKDAAQKAYAEAYGSIWGERRARGMMDAAKLLEGDT